MAEFRRNHSLLDSGLFVKAGLFALILGGLFYTFQSFLGGELPYNTVEEPDEIDNYTERITDRTFYLPTSTTGQIVEHQYYTLSYSEEHEQAEWVAYEITRQQFEQKWVERTDDFRPDPKVKTKSATLSDYRRSGYDRGHLVPAADMAFNDKAMSETFYMSNMSPQVHHFNTGIWRELEEQTRDWAKKYKHLYVINGPVLTVSPKDKIGSNKVSVPKLYYKVILDITKPELKGIGFIIDNELSNEHLSNYAVSIDEVENLTGIDFFSELLADELEEELESTVELDRWKFSEKRFKLRVEKWNKQ